MESQDFQTTDTQACDEIIIDDWMSCLPINIMEDSIQPIPWEIQLEEKDHKVNEASSYSQEKLRTQKMMSSDGKFGTFNESRGEFDAGFLFSNDNLSRFQLERDVLQDENTSAVYSLTSHSKPMQKADKKEEEVVPRNDAWASVKVEHHGDLNSSIFPSDHSEFKNGISCVEKVSAKLSFDEDGDGYNWRKYGQKHVKETNCPRSYYRCTFPGCSAKKQLEKGKDGVVLDVIRRGQHNHPPVRGSLLDSRKFSHFHQKRIHQGRCARENAVSLPTSDQKRIKVFKEGYEDTCWPGANQMYDDSPRERQRIVQTRTEDNVILDGYRWRKYGQKLVKGSTYPRSYYRCTSSGCKVRKHSERSKDNPRILVTTYDGEHNHTMPGNVGKDEDCRQTVSTETERKIKAATVKINDTCTATPRKLEDPVKSAVILAETFLSQQSPCYDFEEIFPDSLVTRPLELPIEVSLPDEECMLHLMDSEFSNTWMTVPENRWKAVENIDAFAMLREPLTPVL